MSPAPPHLIIAGGGLAGGLAALAMTKWRPAVTVTLVEPGPIGGHHLWSFFGADVAAADWPLVTPLIGYRWPGYDVRFPAYRRHFDQPYHSIESETLDAAVRAALPAAAIVTARVVAIDPTGVTLDDGRRIDGDATIDARGLSAAPAGLTCGWQKFVGRLIDVADGHGLAAPVVMDATVDQAEGYRFVYALPFDATRLFVEDTYYSDTPDLDDALLSRRIDQWIAARGMATGATLRQERGVLPVVMGGDFDRFWPADDPVARAGVRAGLFHPLTSYSLPDAVRFAGWLAREAPLDASLGAATRQRASDHWRRGRFDRLLARMLFQAARPAERYRVLERFYTLPDALIARFYAGQSDWTDRVRLLAGKPPVPVGAALRAMVSG